ncbi:MAG: IS1 family transposase [Clostridium butyricum]|nr:IS1 family transposase [Clostridium butyricum]
MIQKDNNFEKLNKHVGLLLKYDIYKNRHIKECPNCNEKSYIKFGKYNGIQRYKCKKCCKTFSKTTKALWSYSKKDAEIWVKFMELTLQKTSLRTCSKILKINIRTAFMWRHKVMQCMIHNVVADKLEGKVFITKAIQKENFKGCRNITTSERKNVWIVGAKDRRDSMIIVPLCNNYWNKDSFKKLIYSKIKKDSYIVPDYDRYMMNEAKKHNKGIVLNVYKGECMKNFRENLKRWIGEFKGVATKYLSEYLTYFIIFNVYKKFDSLELTYNLSKIIC